jgi:hypothetical protein
MAAARAQYPAAGQRTARPQRSLAGSAAGTPVPDAGARMARTA